jgi:DnaK suppressor protein
MDEKRARELVEAERARAVQLLSAAVTAGNEDHEAANDLGDMTDPAQWLTDAGLEDAVAELLRERLAAVERAEQRLANGTYGRSVRSGAPIPDERLEADPLAELTLEEAEQEA